MKAAAFGSSTAAAAAMKRDTDAMIIVCRPQPAARLGVGKWQRAGKTGNFSIVKYFGDESS